MSSRLFYLLLIRPLLLAAALLLPLAGQAQLFGGPGFEAGSYVLNESQSVRRDGQLKLRSNTQLQVKDAAGKTLKLTPAQVYCFHLGRSKYVTAGNFHVKGGLGGDDVSLAFVEQLDSGQVILLRYEYSVGAPMTMGAGGAMTGGGSSELGAYLLGRSFNAELTVAQPGAYSSGGKGFREAVRPYLAARPDLQKLLDEKRINVDNLAAAIHALNHNLPFNPPSALNLE